MCDFIASSPLVMIACVTALPGRRLAVTEPVSIVLPALTAVWAVPLRATIPPAVTAAFAVLAALQVLVVKLLLACMSDAHIRQ